MRRFVQPRTSSEASIRLRYSFDSSKGLGEFTPLGEHTSAIEERAKTQHLYLDILNRHA